MNVSKYSLGEPKSNKKKMPLKIPNGPNESGRNVCFWTKKRYCPWNSMTLSVAFYSRLLSWAVLLKKLKISFWASVDWRGCRQGPPQGRGHRHSKKASVAGGKISKGNVVAMRQERSRVGVQWMGIYGHSYGGGGGCQDPKHASRENRTKRWERSGTRVGQRNWAQGEDGESLHLWLQPTMQGCMILSSTFYIPPFDFKVESRYACCYHLYYISTLDIKQWDKGTSLKNKNLGAPGWLSQ